jgi:hypothetical protein
MIGSVVKLYDTAAVLSGCFNFGLDCWTVVSGLRLRCGSYTRELDQPYRNG